MNLFIMRFFQAGFFKQVKFLVSSPQKAQKFNVIMEAGSVSMEYIPLYTGFACLDLIKKAWKILHSLKFTVYKDGQPFNDEYVLSISERSYLPLDPLGVLKSSKDKKAAMSLDDIAELKHDEALADCGGGESRTQLSHFIISSSFVILGIFAFVTLLKGC